MAACGGSVESVVARSEDVPAADDWLSEREAAHLATLHVPKRHADWRLGRWTAKQAVWTYLSGPAPLAAIEIVAAPCGAPEVWLRGSPAPVAISLSHSGDTGFCVVAPAGTELGCDVETVEARSAAFVADYFTAEEQVLVAEAPQEDRDYLITVLWSAKESVLKALRRGLRADTRDVAVTPFAGGRFSARHISGRDFRGWWRAAGNLVWTAVPV
jgi:4'-phosphopantetheinyl transferase